MFEATVDLCGTVLNQDEYLVFPNTTECGGTKEKK